MTSIQAIATALPATELTNADLEHENPSWNMRAIAKRTGVESRRVVAEDETALDLSLRACEYLRDDSGHDLSNVGAIVYCTLDPEHPMPGNAHLLHARLGLDDHVLAFDYNLACSGYVYGLAFADAFARSNMASEILLVTAETQSRRINQKDRSVRSLLGDGAAVTLLSAADHNGGKIVASQLCSHGQGFAQVYVPAGGARKPSGPQTRREETDASGNIRTAEDMHMDGAGAWGLVNSIVPGHIESFLAAHSLSPPDIDLFVFHQASRIILDSLAKSLSLPAEKVFVHMKDIGNLSSASIPFALRAALDQGAIEPGSRVLLSGFGSGLSYGSVIVDFPQPGAPAEES